MHWSHFINLSQPANKNNDYVRKAATTCYLPLIEILKAHSKAHITVNIDGNLAERLTTVGHKAVLEGFRDLAAKGQVEFTASAYAAPVLGPMKPEEMKAAIKKNTDVMRGFMGDTYKPTGFFPPEMAYDPHVAPVVNALGYRWIVLDEMSHSGTPGSFLQDRVYVMDGMPDLKIVFRNRSMSTGILYGQLSDADKFMDAQKGKTGNGYFIVTGTEADLYGMRRTGPRDFLVNMMDKMPAPMVTIAEVIKLISQTEKVKPVPSTWSTWDTLAF